MDKNKKSTRPALSQASEYNRHILDTMMEAFPDIEKTEMFVCLKRCMEKCVPHRMENEFIYPDGTKGWFELSIQSVPEDVFVLSRDIVENFPDMIHSVDQKGHVIFANKKERELLGYSEDELIGISIKKSIRPIYGTKCRKVLTG